MSKTIDERVVSMQFDNKNFESNVKTSLSTLDKLKQSLRLTDAAKGLENVNATANRMDMSGLSNSVETVKAKFSALQVVAITALSNITNSALNAGKRIVSALTIEPVKMGFQEYETQINAVQTILANTQSKGSTLEDVNKALDELNKYADQTIYNFTEMTKNIGTFTAAGVDLDKSVTSIKGIANLAAVSGSTSMQASTAMYQLSQALAAGKVQLMDWNSVVNAGMGGEVFQTALKRTAKNMGTDVDALIKKYGSFRESLTKGGWLTAEVLTETLTQLSGAYTEADLIAQGYTKKQAKEIVELANTAVGAATDVKTFTQLIDTTKEALQSGWTQSWEIIIGDFEEAKALWSDVGGVLGDIINKSAESRNNLLQGWSDLGGRKDIIDGIKNAFDGISSVVSTVGDAFREIFPPTTAKQLYDITHNFKEFTETLKPSAETLDKIKRTAKGVFSALDLIGKGFKLILSPITQLLGSNGIGSVADLLLDIAASIGDFFTSLNNSVEAGTGFKSISDGISKGVNGISDALETATGGVEGFKKILSSISDFAGKAFGKIGDVIGDAFNWITDNVSIGDIFAGLAGGGIFVAFKKLSDLLGKIGDLIDKIFGKGDDGPNIGDKFADVLDSVHGALESFQTGIRTASLVSIAVAVGILSASLSSIAKLDAADITKSILAIAALLTMLSLSFRSLTKSLSKYNAKGTVRAGIAMIAMSVAIKILADAVEKLGEMSVGDLAKGLTALAVGLLTLIGAMKLMEKVNASLKGAASIVILAEGCKILADALSKFGEMSWEEIARGLVAMGGALLELTAVIAILNKLGGGGKSLLDSVSIAIMIASLGTLANALKQFGSMSWDEIGRGLAAMGGALLELGVISGLLGKLAGGSGLLGAATIVIGVIALKPLANALKQFGSMSWDEIGKGLVAMGGALLELGVISGVLGKLAGGSGLLGAATILIAVQSVGPLADALQKFGEMSWDEIGRGLVAMGGALLELGVISGVLGYVAGAPGLLGAATILIAVQSLEPLATSLEKFGSMSWDEIGRGLSAMGGALGEVALISGLTGLTGFAGLVGAGTITLAVQGLDQLANALIKFGSMSWDEIGRGLSAMGAAMGETALGGLLNTFSGLGVASIAEMAGPLGTLADSVKKWEGVSVPENLGSQLGSLGNGITKFNMKEIGGAGALSEVAAPLGTLAESVKKWTGVTVPEGLADGLGEIASGVKSFAFAFSGGWAMGDITGPLGNMADSVKKWSGVTIPEGLGDGLSSLAKGVESFSFAFLGGWSLGDINGPLGDLAGTVSKWSGVTIPENIGTGLSSLAEGVKSFSWSFVGGWSMDAVIGPLGELGDVIQKWNGISISSTIGDGIKSLGSGVKSLSDAKVSNITEACNAIRSIGTAVKDISGIDFASVSTKLLNFATAVNSIKISTDSFSNLSKNIVNGFVNSINSGQNQVKSSATSLGNIAIKSFTSAISNTSSKGISAGLSLMTSFINGIKSGSNSVKNTISSTITSSLSVISSKTFSFNTAGTNVMTKFVSGITSGKSKVSTSFTSTLSNAVASIRRYYSSFYNAGSYLVMGFANGISSNSYMAAARSKAMASAAADAARKELDEHSPSKVGYKIGDFFGVAFVNAISDYEEKAYKAGSGMANSAKTGLSKAISNIPDIINSNIDTQPTIRPILDLSDISDGTKTMNKLFDITPSVGVMSKINSLSNSMNNRQNGNVEVISAIKDLKKTLNNMPSGDTYNVNGVTYDDGSNVSEAVGVLVRAAKIERRV